MKKYEEVKRIKKGQSSVEYLGTYAWAFLGLILTVGALNYFGVLDSSSYTPERCDSGSQISCIDTFLGYNTTDDNTTFLLMLKNNYPKIIVIENVTLKKFQEQTITPIRDNITVEPGRLVTFAFNTSTNIVPGQKETINFIITYRRSATGSASHNITGSSVVEVQKLMRQELYCGDNKINVSIGEECDPPSSFCRSDCTLI